MPPSLRGLFSPGGYDLERFVAAQEPVYAHVLAELRAGGKRSHWMWFIFPQIRGLGSSPTAQRYAIASLDEARAYLAHPTLAPRLIECTELVNDIAARTRRANKDDARTRRAKTDAARPPAHGPDSGNAPRNLLDDIFGFPDNLKFHSSMTLFALAAADSPTQPKVFQQALQTFFAGERDQATLQRV